MALVLGALAIIWLANRPGAGSERYSYSDVSVMTCQDFVDALDGPRLDMLRAIVSELEDHPDPGAFGHVSSLTFGACHGESLFVDGQLVYRPTDGKLVPNILGAWQSYDYEYKKEHAPDPKPTVLQPATVP